MWNRGVRRVAVLFQPPLPPSYAALTDEQLLDRIERRKRGLGDRVVILGHHYRQDDVIQFADFTGDSLKLSQIAAQQDAEFVVFRRVHFTAESARTALDLMLANAVPPAQHRHRPGRCRGFYGGLIRQLPIKMRLGAVGVSSHPGTAATSRGTRITPRLEVRADYVGFDVEDRFVVGYDLDYNGQ